MKCIIEIIITLGRRRIFRPHYDDDDFLWEKSTYEHAILQLLLSGASRVFNEIPQRERCGHCSVPSILVEARCLCACQNLFRFFIFRARKKNIYFIFHINSRKSSTSAERLRVRVTWQTSDNLLLTQFLREWRRKKSTRTHNSIEMIHIGTTLELEPHRKHTQHTIGDFSRVNFFSSRLCAHSSDGAKLQETMTIDSKGARGVIDGWSGLKLKN